MLLERGAAVNGHWQPSPAALKRAPIPLTGASRNNQVKVVRILLEHGADAGSKGSKTAIEAAAACGHFGVVKLLLNADAHYPLEPDVYHLAILQACKSNHVEMVRLLAQRITPTSCNENRLQKLSSAMYVAIYNDNVEIVDILLRTGAYEHVCLNHKASLAIEKRSIAILKILLEHGADPHGCRHPPESSLPPHIEVSNLLSIALGQWPVDDRMTNIYSTLASIDNSMAIQETEKMLRHLLKENSISHAEFILTKLGDLHVRPFDLSTESLELLDQEYSKLAKTLLDQTLRPFPDIHSEVMLTSLNHHMKTMIQLRK